MHRFLCSLAVLLFSSSALAAADATTAHDMKNTGSVAAIEQLVERLLAQDSR